MRFHLRFDGAATSRRRLQDLQFLRRALGIGPRVLAMCQPGLKRIFHIETFGAATKVA